MRAYTSIKALTLASAGVMAITGSASAASVNANASAEVIAPIAIVETTALDFGIFAKPTVGGNVVLDVSGGRTSTGDVELVLESGGAQTQAVFTITGEVGTAFGFTRDATVSVDDPGAGDPMVATLSDDSDGANDVIGTPATINVFGTLPVAAGQLAGTYVGNYSVSVLYD